MDKFPGVNKFLDDVVTLLESKYGFSVIEDAYDGVLSKGHVSDRPESNSVYIDSYYDISNSGPVLDRLGVKPENIPSGRVMCFTHLRFSDHVLADEGDLAHVDHVNKNADKYTIVKELDSIYKDESFGVPEREPMLEYESALDDLFDQLDTRILYWVKKANKSSK